jgi:hypothetical protein
LSEQEKDIFSSHSVDEATGRHKHKLSIRHKPMPVTNNNGAEKKQ